MGYSAMRTIDPMIKAILATGGLTEKDVTPVLVPNVVRGADDFASGAADMFFFAFGAPKVREVDATVGGIRALEIPEKRHGRRPRSSCPRAICRRRCPSPFFVGVDHPMGVYTWDNMIFTNAKVTRRRRLQDHRHAGEEQSRPGRGPAGVARVLGGRRSTSTTTSPITPAP